MKILAFGHKSRVGKDTACQILLQYFKENHPDLKVERRAFADVVKDISYSLYKNKGLMGREYYDKFPAERTRKLKSLDKDAVEVWVAVGNKVREIYKHTWIDLVLEDTSCDLLIISDMRYPNELESVKKLGGVCVRIDKDSAEIRNTIADNALNDYQDWNGIIENNNSMEEFKFNLIKLVLPLLGF